MTESRHRNDRGVTVVVFAVSITALLAVASLVMGGSNGYSAARNSQTAADAASQAATKTMREVWQGLVPLFDDGADTTSAVYDTAVRVAEENGADPGSVECEVVRSYYAVSYNEAYVLGPCNGSFENAMDADSGLPIAAGVRIRVEETRDVPFGGVIERDTITASAVATSTVQPVRGGFRTPFMLCSFAEGHGIDLLVADPDADPPFRVNPAALNVEFLLWSNGNGMAERNCGVQSWRGLVNQNVTYQLPSDASDDSGWWDTDPGSKVGQISTRLGGDDACDWMSGDVFDNEDGCRTPLPLCVEATNHSNGGNERLNCVRMATFLITHIGDGDAVGSCASDAGNKVVCGRLLPDAGTAAEGQGTLDEVDPFEYAVIKLVE